MVKCDNRDCTHNHKGFILSLCRIEPKINSKGMCVSCKPDKERMKRRKELFKVE